jgi:hypothetical protein
MGEARDEGKVGHSKQPEMTTAPLHRTLFGQMRGLAP